MSRVSPLSILSSRGAVRLSSSSTMSGTTHPFSGYNKKDIHKTLVGNWNEERHLEELTGVHRYKSWADKAENDESVYPNRVGLPDPIPTFPRVFAHSDCIDAAEWMTHNTGAFRDPGSRDSTDLRVYSNNSDPRLTGKRTTMMMQQMMAAASTEEPEPEPKMMLETTVMADYGKKSLADINVGLRVMKTQDGENIPLEKRDKTFLYEKGIIKSLGGPVSIPEGSQCFTGRYDKDVPYTIYREKVEKGQMPGDGVYMATSCEGGNPFSKTRTLTREVDNYRKETIPGTISCAGE